MRHKTPQSVANSLHLLNAIALSVHIYLCMCVACLECLLYSLQIKISIQIHESFSKLRIFASVSNEMTKKQIYTYIYTVKPQYEHSVCCISGKSPNKLIFQNPQIKLTLKFSNCLV